MNFENLKKPLLVALDVDGTIARSDGSISENTCKAVSKIRSAGIKVVIATGRPWTVALDSVNKVNGVDYIIGSNGAMTLNWPEQEVLQDIYLSENLPKELVQQIRDIIPGIGCAFEFQRGVKAEPGLAERLPSGVSLGKPVMDVLTLNSRPVRKLLIWHDEYELSELEETIKEIIGERGQTETSGLNFFQVGPAGINKASALNILINKLDISVDDVWAFGDEKNDIEMLKWAGKGFAMANAGPSVIESADLIAPNNDEDGVAKVLESLSL